MTCTFESAFGDAPLTSGVCWRMATQSATVSVFVPRGPVRTPLTARPPASIQTKLSPSWLSARSTRVWPACPIATTQMTAAIPIVMPKTVSKLRSLFRSSAQSDDPRSAGRSMGRPRYQRSARMDDTSLAPALSARDLEGHRAPVDGELVAVHEVRVAFDSLAV